MDSTITLFLTLILTVTWSFAIEKPVPRSDVPVTLLTPSLNQPGSNFMLGLDWCGRLSRKLHLTVQRHMEFRAARDQSTLARL